MPQMQNAQTVALQLEKVRDKLPLLYERDDILLTMIQQRGDVERVSSRNMRLPLQIRPGGKAGLANLDGGDLGRGSGTTYDVAQVTPVFFRHAVEISKLVEYASNSPEKAIENAAKREVKNNMQQFRSFLDKVMQTNGNGVLGTIASISGSTFTMAKPPGSVLVYYNQTIQIYDPTLTTNRNVAAGVTTNVTAVDPFGGTITVDNIPTGTSPNDLIVHDGLSGAQPVSLFGILYHQTNATTGTWLNLNRATYPVELATPHVSGNNSALTPGVVRLAINKVRKSLGTNQVGKLIAYTSLEQEHAWEQLGVTISQIIKEGAGGRASDLDLLPARKRWRACRLNRPSTPTRHAWISSISRTGAARSCRTSIFTMSAGKPFSRFTAPAVVSLRRTSFTSSRDSRCGTIRRAPGRTSILSPSHPATKPKRCKHSFSIRGADHRGVGISLASQRRVTYRKIAGRMPAPRKPFVTSHFCSSLCFSRRPTWP
ncbi:MAG TPA: hypothetical protein VIH76_14240 [Candidatus Acidoferrales bacterium]